MAAPVTTRRPRFLGEPTSGEVQTASFPKGGEHPVPRPVAPAAPKPDPARLAERRPAPQPAPSAPVPAPAASPQAAPAPAPNPMGALGAALNSITPPGMPPAPPGRDSLEQLAAAVESLRLIGGKLAEQARADALEIAFQVARKILETELTASPQPLFALVRSAVRRVGEAREIAIRLCPQDAAALEAGPHTELGLTLAKVTIVADPALGRGDCVVESDLGTVDGRLSSRLAELKRSLAEAIAGDAA